MPRFLCSVRLALHPAQRINQRFIRRVANRILDNYGVWVYEIRDNRIYDTFGNWKYEFRGGNRIYDTYGNWLYEIRGDRIYDTYGNWLGSEY